MSFVQAVLVIVCILTIVTDALLFVCVASLPQEHPNLGVVVKGFIYCFVPAVLAAGYLLHLLTAGVS